MKIAEVLEEMAKIYPKSDPKEFHVTAERSLRGDGRDQMTYWIFVPDWADTSKKCFSSYRSWEHALAQAKAEESELWEATAVADPEAM